MVIFTVLMKPGVIESSQSKARTRTFFKKEITNVVTVMLNVRRMIGGIPIRLIFAVIPTSDNQDELSLTR